MLQLPHLHLQTLTPGAVSTKDPSASFIRRGTYRQALVQLTSSTRADDRGYVSRSDVIARLKVSEPPGDDLRNKRSRGIDTKRKAPMLGEGQNASQGDDPCECAEPFGSQAVPFSGVAPPRRQLLCRLISNVLEKFSKWCVVWRDLRSVPRVDSLI
jgi:hypothetical protein